MSKLARYHGRHRLKGSLSLSVAMSLLAVVVIWIYPSFSGSFTDIDEEFLQAYPEGVRQLFDIRTMTSLEGFLAFELYVFGWTILLGLYLAYLAAGSIASDVESGRMDMLLSMPISRARVVTETFASLAVPIAAVNLITPLVVYVTAGLVGEPIAAVDIVAVHLLSVPYLVACGAIGLVASVVVDRASIAQRIALGTVFGLFMLDSLLAGTEYEAIAAIAPMAYYDPNAILIDGQYDLVGVAVLTAMTIGLVAISQYWFRRVDID